ncbi:MAG: YraN family protein [Myxococcaceae bacterium]|nr:YraN family protein [Myxococcaceae bacterium]
MELGWGSGAAAGWSGGGKPGAPRRQRGDDAEALVCAHLEEHGYRIRERNAAYRFGELDVVAEKDGVLCFVEVRMRSSAVFGDPAATVSGAKQRKVVRSAMLYLQRERLWNRVQVRFDVASVVGRGPRAVIEHLPGAFDAGF